MARVDGSQSSNLTLPPQWPGGNVTCTQCELLLDAANISSSTSSGWPKLSAIRLSAAAGCRCCHIVWVGVSTSCPAVQAAPDAVCFGRRVVAGCHEWLRIGLKFSQDDHERGIVREWIDFDKTNRPCKTPCNPYCSLNSTLSESWRQTLQVVLATSEAEKSRY
jgi:hypothetical protein